MRLLTAFVVVIACGSVTSAQDAPPSGACPAFFRCHDRHGTEKKACPKCAKPIPGEDALCSDCGYKEKLCRHCGLPKGNGAGGAGAAAGGGKDRSSPGKPRAVQKEVSISVGGAEGEITGRFCPDKLVIEGDTPPEKIPPGRPLLVSWSNPSPASVEGLLGRLKQALGKDYATLAIEVKDRGDFARYNEVAALIKKKEPRILVGGPGTIGIHDREGLKRFGAVAKPVDFLSGDYSKGSQWAHPKYDSGDLRMVGVHKTNFDTFFDIASEIGGKINYPPKAGLGLTAYGFSGSAAGEGPENECFAAGAVCNFAVSHVQKGRQSEGRPLVIGPIDPGYAEAFRIGHELLWPSAHPSNGDPYEPSVPIGGCATRNPATKMTWAIFCNNSKLTVKVKASISGKGSQELYFDPFEVKVLKLP